MSLRDDIEAMERHSRHGTLREWFEGTAPILPAHDRISDPTAMHSPNSTYHFIKRRGD